MIVFKKEGKQISKGFGWHCFFVYIYLMLPYIENPKPLTMRTITFNELQRIKDSLPIDSMKNIAHELNTNVDSVQNFFSGFHFKEGKCIGIYFEPGPDGGLIMLDDAATLHVTILNFALKILMEKGNNKYYVK
jgi:hypothetical protein